MSDHQPHSRANRHQKKQKQNKRIVFFIGLGALFLVFLLTWMTVGNKEKQVEPEKSQAELATNHQGENESENDNNQDDTEEFNLDDKEDENDQEADKDDETDIREIDTDDSDVEKSYEGNWDPVDTKQTGEHVTSYDDHSDDRKEIKEAVIIATGIEADDMIEHWVGNGGEQKVEATVSEKSEETSYHVYLSWIDNEGWLVERVDKLKEYQGS